MKCGQQSNDACLDPTLQRVVRDHHLVLDAQAGSPSAFAELQTLYAQRLYATIFRITKNREDAEDALQDTFLHAYSAMHTFQGRSGVSSWLTRIAINSALMVLRKRRARAEVFFDISNGDNEEVSTWEPRDTTPNPEQRYAQHQRHAVLASIVRTLEPGLRVPLQLQMTGDYSLEEISRIVGTSVAAIKSKLFRARRRLSSSHVVSNRCSRGRLGQTKHAGSHSLDEGSKPNHEPSTSRTKKRRQQPAGMAVGV